VGYWLAIIVIAGVVSVWYYVSRAGGTRTSEDRLHRLPLTASKF
jgi:hypothetical protein